MIYIKDERFQNDYLFCVNLNIDVYDELFFLVSSYWKVSKQLNCNIECKNIDICGSEKLHGWSNNRYYINYTKDKDDIIDDIIYFIRLFLKIFLQRKGYLNLHAACVCINGKSFIISAERFNGKTTLLLYLLKNRNVSFIANDQIMLSISEKIILPFPARIGIRYSSLELNKISIDLFNGNLVTINDPFETEKISVYSSVLCNSFGSKIENIARISYVIFYKKSANINCLKIERKKMSFTKLLSDIELNLSKTYNLSLIRDIETYLKQDNRDKKITNHEEMLEVYYVECGINKVDEMIKQIMEENVCAK